MVPYSSDPKRAKSLCFFCRQQHMYDEITKSEDKNQYEAILKKGIYCGILFFVCSDYRMDIDDYHITNIYHFSTSVWQMLIC